jgi:hypothetical protein
MLVRLTTHSRSSSATGPRTGEGGWLAQPQEYLVVLGDHVLDREPDDAGERLGVEQHDRRCRAGPRGFVVLDQQTPEQFDALLLRQRNALAFHRGRESESHGEPAVHAPGQEGAQAVSCVDAVFEEPDLEIGLTAGRQGEVTVGEPAEEGRGVG